MGGRQKLDVPVDAWASWEGDWLAVRTRTAWTVGEQTFAPDTVVVTGLAAFLAGERDFVVVFEPGERRALQRFFWSAGRLILHVLDEMRPVVHRVHDGAGLDRGADRRACRRWGR